jgi:hypothetical protein
VARKTAAEPFGERLAGVRAAARDLVRERQRFIGTHADALLDALDAEGIAAAHELDDAAHRVVDADTAREQVAARIFSLFGEVPFVPEDERAERDGGARSRPAANGPGATMARDGR